MSKTTSQTFDEAMEAHVRNVLDQMLMGTENYFGATGPKRDGRIRIAHGLIVREIVKQAQKAAAAEREACTAILKEVRKSLRLGCMDDMPLSLDEVGRLVDDFFAKAETRP